MPPHEELVTDISSVVKAFYAGRQSFRIFHGSTSSTRPAHDARVVDISALSKVLEVDAQRKRAIVEPNVAMDKLVQATLAQGMIPPIVMEFPGITVGGGYAGSAGESSSYKYGYFDETVESVEIVLATGEVIVASESEHADIFKGAAGSLGTLGIITKLQLKLIPAKRFVKLTYCPYTTSHSMIEALKQATKDPEIDYVDGIMFSKTHGVLMTGQLTDDIPSSEKPHTFSGPWDQWFYLHAMGKSVSKASTDYIPIAEYLFRFDRGGFWAGAVLFGSFSFFPFNRFTRWLLDDLMHTRMMYRALHASNMSSGTIVHDLSLPYDTAEDFINYAAQEFDIWPLWLCPLRAVNPPTFHPYSTGSESGGAPQPMLNIGLWGTASKDIDSFVRQNRQLEARVTELGGRKVLYSHTYYTEEEFWQLYDRDWYEALRQHYSASSLPTVYDKVKVDVARMKQVQNVSWIRRLASLWPFAGFVGMWAAIWSKDYLLHKRRDWMRWRLAKDQ